MTYNEAIEYMYSQLPMFHRVGKAAYKANLNNALALDAYFDHPHKNYAVIHVAGTNGKGSVSHMLAAILQTAGYKTGLFTSPHLKNFRERIRINGEMVSESEVATFITKHKSVFDNIKPSFFEMTSAMAFEHFSQCEVDVAVIEVGLGGRLDSTNIVNPLVSVITNIGFDHMEFLGDTLEKIAFEKAGIIKTMVPVVIGESTSETRSVFEVVALTNDAPLYFAEEIYQADYSMVTAERKQIIQVNAGKEHTYKNLELDLGGNYQRKNLCTVLTVIDLLRDKGWKIVQHHISDALAKVMPTTGLMGRWQELGHNPLIICDTGHNSSGMKWVISQILSVPCKNLHMVIGFVNDKDIHTIISMLPTHAIYYFTQANIPRALPAEVLCKSASEYNLLGSYYKSVELAFMAAKQAAQPEDFIFIGGSTFVVAEVL
jgi:dihydrofolate synthase / folylpolyglutamate synthase